MSKYFTYFESPIGPILLSSNGSELSGLYLNSGRHTLTNTASWIRNDDAEPFPEVKRQLAEYFAGTRTDDFDLPLAFDFGTPFQQLVWQELAQIPFGQTITYGELARRIGDPKASRAVGLANGKNPISIIVPCHRVIGSNGKLTGYGGGIENKEVLLSFEAKAARHVAEGREGNPIFGAEAAGDAAEAVNLFA